MVFTPSVRHEGSISVFPVDDLAVHVSAFIVRFIHPGIFPLEEYRFPVCPAISVGYYLLPVVIHHPVFVPAVRHKDPLPVLIEGYLNAHIPLLIVRHLLLKHTGDFHRPAVCIIIPFQNYLLLIIIFFF